MAQASFIEDTLKTRRSVRAFKASSIPEYDIQRILTAARLAPSGANLQPGRFHVLTNTPLHALSDTLVQAHNEGREIVSQYSYFPDPLPKHLRQKQVKAGRALYDALGISRDDADARAHQFIQNYRFFGAPVGIVVTIERDMGAGCFMDLGLTLMALMLAAQERGYGTCGIGALANYGDIVHQHLSLPQNELVVCGLALGVADENHKVNNTKTQRDTLSGFCDFYGFSEDET